MKDPSTSLHNGSSLRSGLLRNRLAEQSITSTKLVISSSTGSRDKKLKFDLGSMKVIH